MTGKDAHRISTRTGMSTLMEMASSHQRLANPKTTFDVSMIEWFAASLVKQSAGCHADVEVPCRYEKRKKKKKRDLTRILIKPDLYLICEDILLHEGETPPYNPSPPCCASAKASARPSADLRRAQSVIQ